MPNLSTQVDTGGKAGVWIVVALFDPGRLKTFY